MPPFLTRHAAAADDRDRGDHGDGLLRQRGGLLRSGVAGRAHLHERRLGLSREAWTHRPRPRRGPIRLRAGRRPAEGYDSRSTVDHPAQRHRPGPPGARGRCRPMAAASRRQPWHARRWRIGQPPLAARPRPPRPTRPSRSARARSGRRSRSRRTRPSGRAARGTGCSPLRAARATAGDRSRHRRDPPARAGRALRAGRRAARRMPARRWSMSSLRSTCGMDAGCGRPQRGGPRRRRAGRSRSRSPRG